MEVHLVLEIVPPVRPRLLHATLLLDDCIIDDTAKNAECHRDTMVIVAVDAGTLLELSQWLPIDLQTIVQLSRLHAELG